mgnify:CR=1 FL=1
MLRNRSLQKYPYLTELEKYLYKRDAIIYLNKGRLNLCNAIFKENGNLAFYTSFYIKNEELIIRDTLKKQKIKFSITRITPTSFCLKSSENIEYKFKKIKETKDFNSILRLELIFDNNLLYEYNLLKSIEIDSSANASFKVRNLTEDSIIFQKKEKLKNYDFISKMIEIGSSNPFNQNTDTTNKYFDVPNYFFDIEKVNQNEKIKFDGKEKMSACLKCFVEMFEDFYAMPSL